MRRFVFSGLVLTALAVGATTARADGWPTMTWGSSAPAVSYGSPVVGATFSGAGGAVGGAVTGGALTTYPYSYWAAWPGPARGYVGYGASDGFAFYGSPYGHANDRWSWSSMSGQNVLSRYYYPPVR